MARVDSCPCALPLRRRGLIAADRHRHILRLGQRHYAGRHEGENLVSVRLSEQQELLPFSVRVLLHWTVLELADALH